MTVQIVAAVPLGLIALVVGLIVMVVLDEMAAARRRRALGERW